MNTAEYLLETIRRLADQDGWTRASAATLGQAICRTGRTAQTLLRSLEDRGLIEVRHNLGRYGNSYRLRTSPESTQPRKRTMAEILYPEKNYEEPAENVIPFPQLQATGTEGPSRKAPARVGQNGGPPPRIRARLDPFLSPSAQTGDQRMALDAADPAYAHPPVSTSLENLDPDLFSLELSEQAKRGGAHNSEPADQQRPSKQPVLPAPRARAPLATLEDLAALWTAAQPLIAARFSRMNATLVLKDARLVGRTGPVVILAPRPAMRGGCLTLIAPLGEILSEVAGRRIKVQLDRPPPD